MTTPFGIRAVAQWAALSAALSVELSLAESRMAAEGLPGVPALAQLLAAQRAAFKGPHYSTAPMDVACAVDGRNASG